MNYFSFQYLKGEDALTLYIYTHIARVNNSKTKFMKAFSHRGGVHISLAVLFGNVKQAVHYPERHRGAVVSRFQRLLDEFVDDVAG